VERLQQIEEIFHQALKRGPAERDAFVRQACRDDSDLRRQVVSLLENHDDGDSLDPAATLEPGQSLGPYRIDCFIAAGGMGKVYRATDTRLNRTVAIKVSAAHFSERFEREARVIASLNHPHICTLYDVGPNYLVMEFVEGAPLPGPLPLQKAIEYAGQILDALETAHRKGIVHRDLKPANILLTKQGIKLLDFGLAKQNCSLTEADATLATGLTREGQVAGTLQYMSPEQLHGTAADARSDLFSFGCVLYEMLSGKRAFEGQSAASVVAAILEREPAPLNLSPPLEQVVKTCLAKNPDDRFQNALDLKRALAWAAQDQPVIAAPLRVRRWTLAVAAALLLGVLAGGWAVSHLRQPAADDRVTRFQVPPPEGGGMLGGGSVAGGLAISPDGHTAAFVGAINGKTGLWVRPLDAVTARLVPGTEDARMPFWSPDSSSIAFAAGSSLRRVDLSRQTTSTICDLADALWGGSWSNDGVILFGIRSRGIFQVPASGGTPSQLTTVDRAHGEINHIDPRFLTGGRFLYTVMNADSQNGGIYAASLAKPADRVQLVPNVQAGQYAAGVNGKDYLLWIRDRILMAQEFHADRLQLIGKPHSVASPVTVASAGNRALLYASSYALLQLKWFDRKGKETGLLGEPGTWVFNRISPDGRRVVTVRAGDLADIWLLETGRGVASRLTTGPTVHLRPIWSPDGRTILFSLGPSFNLFRASLERGGDAERVTEAPARHMPDDWSRDGRYVLYSEVAPDTGSDLWVLPVTPEGRPSPGAKPWPFVRDRFDQAEGCFSPDDRWVAYQSDESGRSEIYVRSFPVPREKLRISTGGGVNPRWGAGGRELFYQSPDGKLMTVALKPSGTTLDASLPRELSTLPTGIPPPNVYDAAPDGQHFLAGDISAGTDPLTVIVNWQALLKEGSSTP